MDTSGVHSSAVQQLSSFPCWESRAVAEIEDTDPAVRVWSGFRPTSRLARTAYFTVSAIAAVPLAPEPLAVTVTASVCDVLGDGGFGAPVVGGGGGVVGVPGVLGGVVVVGCFGDDAVPPHATNTPRAAAITNRLSNRVFRRNPGMSTRPKARASAVNLPADPRAPDVFAVVIVSVEVPEPLSEAGLKLQAAAVGRPEHDSAIVPAF